MAMTTVSAVHSRTMDLGGWSFLGRQLSLGSSAFLGSWEVRKALEGQGMLSG